MTLQDIQRRYGVSAAQAMEIQQTHADLAALRQQIAALRDALRTYGHHHATCKLRTHVQQRDAVCSCGLFAVLADPPAPASTETDK